MCLVFIGGIDHFDLIKSTKLVLLLIRPHYSIFMSSYPLDTQRCGLGKAGKICIVVKSITFHLVVQSFVILSISNITVLNCTCSTLLHFDICTFTKIKALTYYLQIFILQPIIYPTRRQAYVVVEAFLVLTRAFHKGSKVHRERERERGSFC